MSENKSVLSCENLSVGYEGKVVLSNVNLHFREAQFISLLGPNGAGKTTLLRTLSRHLQPISGTVTIDGRPLASLHQSELAKIMAVVLTERISLPLFSVFEFVALGRYPHTNFLGRLTKRDRAVVERALSAVHATDLRKREFTSLSDGERQKVLVARALAQEPQVLLLDEPTSHLDLKHRVEVMSILRELCASAHITVIASLHDVDIAAKVSDQVVLVKNGGIIASGAPEEVLCNGAVSELYDFSRARFSQELGSLELQGKKSGREIFVVGGMGRGAAIYRLLSKYDCSLHSGVLFSNDLDAFVADSLGVKNIIQVPSAEVDDSSLDLALHEMEQCDCLVDAGCDLQGIYKGNQALLSRAVKMKKPIFCFHKTGRADDGRVQVAKISDLPAAIEEVMQDRAGT